MLSRGGRRDRLDSLRPSRGPTHSLPGRRPQRDQDGGNRRGGRRSPACSSRPGLHRDAIPRQSPSSRRSRSSTSRALRKGSRSPPPSRSSSPSGSAPAPRPGIATSFSWPRAGSEKPLRRRRRLRGPAVRRQSPRGVSRGVGDSTDSQHANDRARDGALRRPRFLQPSHLAGAAFRLRVFSREREIPFAGYAALGAHFVHALETKLAPDRAGHPGRARGTRGTVRRRAEGRRRPRSSCFACAQRLPETGSAHERARRAPGSPGRSGSRRRTSRRPTSRCGSSPPVCPSSSFRWRPSTRSRRRSRTTGSCADILAGVGDERRSSTRSPRRPATRSRPRTRGRSTSSTSREVAAAGAAAGALAAYLVAQAAVTVRPVTSLVIEQGHVLSRPSTLFAEVQVKDGRISQVSVGGRVIRMGEGVIEF